jgi:hypothetical protein
MEVEETEEKENEVEMENQRSILIFLLGFWF